jgi:ribosomal protein S18 acetylase RimI-like enzyme
MSDGRLPHHSLPLRLDLAGAGDVAFLWEMLTYAASMAPGGATSMTAAQGDPYLRTYVEAGGGRPPDRGVAAPPDAGAPLGAAWVRAGLMLAEPGAPELATAVVPAHRGRGVGAALMGELVRRASGRWDAIVLSVRAENPALRFYERCGFRRAREVANRVGGVSIVMRRLL